MTTINNFDVSSTGTNIEFTGFYDRDQAHQNYHDFFEDMGFVKFFHDGGIVEKMGHINVPFDALLDTLKSKLVTNGEGLLEALTYLGCNGATIGECRENYNNDVTLCSVNKLCYLSNDDIEGLLPEGLALHVSKGYNQGDLALVIYHKQEYPVTEQIDVYLWDTPIYAKLTVNGDEFYLDDDAWDGWNKDGAIERIKYVYNKKDKARVLEWLYENLPEELEYI